MAKFDMAEDMAEVVETFRREWEKHKTQVEQYKPTVYKCQNCKDTGFLDLYPSDPHKSSGGKISTVMYCPYCRANMLRDISGLIAEYRQLDIKKFPWETYAKDVTKLKQTIESFVYDFHRWKDEGVGLYIYSEARGSGKTMVANAICGSICAKYNMPVRFLKVEDFLDDIRKSYGGKENGTLTGVNVGKYFDAELLVIDDLGVSNLNAWGKDRLHELINERYKTGRLCIVTSNFKPENLPIHAPTIDRINDMCLVLHFPEEPIRSQKALTRKNRILQYVNSYDTFKDCDKSPFEGGSHK